MVWLASAALVRRARHGSSESLRQLATTATVE
jgi:hypothetical protein